MDETFGMDQYLLTDYATTCHFYCFLLTKYHHAVIIFGKKKSGKGICQSWRKGTTTPKPKKNQSRKVACSTKAVEYDNLLLEGGFWCNLQL